MQADKERESSASVFHATHILEVKYHISELQSHSRASISFIPCSLFPSIDCLFIPSSFSNQMQAADIQHHTKSWFTYTFLTAITHIHIGHKAFSLPHRNNIFEHTKANKRLSFTLKYTHIQTLTQPNLCVLFALSEMYCLGKWACAPSGGISMNKNLNALPHYFSPSLTFSISHTLSLSLCGLCLSQHPQSLRAQIDIGDLVINMWVLDEWLCFVSLCVSVYVQ